MKILHVCSVENKMSNGATVAVIEHVNEQARTGSAEIYVLHVRDEKLDFDSSVNVVEMSGYKNAIDTSDIIIFHELYYIPYIKLSGYARRKGKPYIVIPHGVITSGAQQMKHAAKTVVNALWARRYIACAAAVQFLSVNELSESMRWNDEGFVMPNGVRMPDEHKRYNGNDSYESATGGLRLIFIGRLNLFHKGLDMMVDACEAIHEKMSSDDISIDIYGPLDSDDGIELQSAVSDRSLQDVIHVHDAIYGEDKAAALLGADIFIQTSRFEGLPMGILQAMSFGLPLIVTPGTNMEDTVREGGCGWECQPDSSSIADTIMMAYEERRTLPDKSKKALAYVRDRYEWSKVASDEIAAYSKYAGRRTLSD